MENRSILKKKLAKDMSREQALRALRIICDELIIYYLQTACPCAFPRFRFLVGFLGKEEIATISKSLIHALDTNLLVAASRESKGFLDNSTCAICGTEYMYEYEQFSISFEEVTLNTKSFQAKDIGAKNKNPTPLFAGLYYTGEDPKLNITTVSLEEFDTYMREVTK